MQKCLSFILIVCLLLISACSDGETQSLENFYKDANVESVNKIIIRDGTTGYSKTLTEQEQINELLTLVKDIKFTPQKNQENHYGWGYTITLYDEKHEFSFSLNKIGDTFYDTNPDIQPIVDDFYKSLDIKEK